MPERTCAECSMRIPATAHQRQVYCSPRCRNRANNRRTKEKLVSEAEHGTRTGYARGCKCRRCRDYLADYSRDYRRKNPAPKSPRVSRKGIKTGRRKPQQHGTSTEYAYGCRCQQCKTARTAENAAWSSRNPEKFKANQRKYRLANPRRRWREVAPLNDEAVEYAEMLLHGPCSYSSRPARHKHRPHRSRHCWRKQRLDQSDRGMRLVQLQQGRNAPAPLPRSPLPSV